MLWKGRDRSGNVEDRRGFGPGGLAIGGGLGGLVIALIVMLLGGDPRQVLHMQEEMSTQPAPGQTGAIEDETSEFVSVVLKDTEDVWSSLLAQSGQTYREPHLTLFSGQVQSACGIAGAAVGPFYCPEDERVYLDAEFFHDLEQLGGAGDFAQAYVIAHEIGHHVQNLLGVSDQVHRMRGQVSEEEYNALSVRLELQADFYAGVWAHHVEARKHILEAGDIDEALQAATAIGDDRMQRRSQGYVVPESFTHGSSEQRERWFRRGFETGDPAQGDTFNARAL